MDYTLVGDPHSTHKSLKRIAQLFGIVEAIGKPAIWTGDLLDTKEVIRGKCLNAFYDYFKSSKLNHIILVGNHDWFNLECKDHSLRMFTELSNVTVVDKPVEIDGMLMIPFWSNLEELKSWLDSSSCEILIGHSDVKTFDYGNGTISKDGLLLSDLSKFKLAVFGHYHKYQQQDNLVFLGSPFSHSFGESDQIKYLGFLNSNAIQLRLAPTPMPRHVTLDLDLGIESYVFDLNGFINSNQGNYKRVNLHGTQFQISSFPRDMYEKEDIKWNPKPTESKRNNIALEEGTDNLVQFSKWASDIKKLDPETTQLGISILRSLNAK